MTDDLFHVASELNQHHLGVGTRQHDRALPSYSCLCNCKGPPTLLLPAAAAAATAALSCAGSLAQRCVNTSSSSSSNIPQAVAVPDHSTIAPVRYYSQ